ncbi:hypothetical protein PENSPDRAFT_672464 [Peniophora sp. CONT]|nr:hypothetical protein PENSPDRAFT_672464 [Peniophora sp. CONT]
MRACRIRFNFTRGAGLDAASLSIGAGKLWDGNKGELAGAYIRTTMDDVGKLIDTLEDEVLELEIAADSARINKASANQIRIADNKLRLKAKELNRALVAAGKDPRPLTTPGTQPAPSSTPAPMLSSTPAPMSSSTARPVSSPISALAPVSVSTVAPNLLSSTPAPTPIVPATGTESSSAPVSAHLNSAPIASSAFVSSSGPAPLSSSDPALALLSSSATGPAASPATKVPHAAPTRLLLPGENDTEDGTAPKSPMPTVEAATSPQEVKNELSADGVGAATPRPSPAPAPSASASATGPPSKIMSMSNGAEAATSSPSRRPASSQSPLPRDRSLDESAPQGLPPCVSRTPLKEPADPSPHPGDTAPRDSRSPSSPPHASPPHSAPGDLTPKSTAAVKSNTVIEFSETEDGSIVAKDHASQAHGRAKRNTKAKGKVVVDDIPSEDDDAPISHRLSRRHRQSVRASESEEDAGHAEEEGGGETEPEELPISGPSQFGPKSRAGVSRGSVYVEVPPRLARVRVKEEEQVSVGVRGGKMARTEHIRAKHKECAYAARMQSYAGYTTRQAARWGEDACCEVNSLHFSLLDWERVHNFGESQVMVPGLTPGMRYQERQRFATAQPPTDRNDGRFALDVVDSMVQIRQLKFTQAQKLYGKSGLSAVVTALVEARHWDSGDDFVDAFIPLVRELTLLLTWLCEMQGEEPVSGTVLAFLLSKENEVTSENTTLIENLLAWGGEEGGSQGEDEGAEEVVVKKEKKEKKRKASGEGGNKPKRSRTTARR